jgi:hypothetical protein
MQCPVKRRRRVPGGFVACDADVGAVYRHRGPPGLVRGLGLAVRAGCRPVSHVAAFRIAVSSAAGLEPRPGRPPVCVIGRRAGGPGSRRRPAPRSGRAHQLGRAQWLRFVAFIVGVPLGAIPVRGKQIARGAPRWGAHVGFVSSGPALRARPSQKFLRDAPWLRFVFVSPSHVRGVAGQLPHLVQVGAQVGCSLLGSFRSGSHARIRAPFVGATRPGTIVIGRATGKIGRVLTNVR